jgi:hypothetical protein
MMRAFEKPLVSTSRSRRGRVIDDRGWRCDPDRFYVLHVLHVLFLKIKIPFKKWAVFSVPPLVRLRRTDYEAAVRSAMTGPAFRRAAVAD